MSSKGDYVAEDVTDSLAVRAHGGTVYVGHFRDEVYVTSTLILTPAVARDLGQSLIRMADAAAEQTTAADAESVA
jgi:hypothetical protein